MAATVEGAIVATVVDGSEREERKHDANLTDGRSWMVRFYRDEDRASVLRLARKHYGDRDLASEAYLFWLYEGGPAGKSNTVVAVLHATGEVIGFIWHVPMLINTDTTPDIGYLGANALVDPDYRRQGVHRSLYLFALKHEEEAGLFIYGFQKPAAVTPLSKHGHIIDKIPLLLRPLDMAGLAKARFANRLIRRSVQLGWAVAANTLFRPRGLPSATRKLNVQFEEQFDESFDDFWDRVSRKYPIMICRDRAFLQWRFSKADFRHYRILTARKNGALSGYAIVRTMEAEGVRTGLLMDLLVEPGVQGNRAGRLLVAEATAWYRQQESHMAAAIMLSHTQEYRILRQAGYVVCPEQLAPQPFRLSRRNLARQIPDEVLASTQNWFITMANHDAV